MLQMEKLRPREGKEGWLLVLPWVAGCWGRIVETQLWAGCSGIWCGQWLRELPL